MSSAEAAARVGGEGSGGRRVDHSCHSTQPVSSSAVEQGPEPAHTPQEKGEPAGNTARNLRTQAQENERAPQEEAVADLGGQDPDASSTEQRNNGEQEEAAVTESRGQTPGSIVDQQESEQEEEDWEEIGSVGEDRPDSDSDGDFNTSSGFELDDNSENKPASGIAEEEEDLPFGCAHYRRKCKIVAPCW